MMKKGSLLWPFFAFCFFVGSIPAQEISTEEGLLQKPTLPEAQALEKTINPDEYIIGPGDVLAVNIWGELSIDLRVTPEGRLLIPTVSDIPVAGIPLSEAKKRIKQEVRRKYIDSEVTVTLVSLRKFKVTVSGAVLNPGDVVVTATDRVSDAIKLAGGFLQPIAVTTKREETSVETPSKKEVVVKTSEVKSEARLVIKEASKRNIRVTRRDGSVLRADILRYQVTGVKRYNPYLLDGDVIYVPIREEDVGVVGIYGAVKSPGLYEYVPGDKLSDIITLAHGLTMDADSTLIEVVRFDEDHKTTKSIKVNLRGNPQDNDIPLKPDDRIFIRSIPDFHEKKQVRVIGEVLYPGEYTIQEGETWLSDIIRQAGGVTEDASLEDAEVIRTAYTDIKDPELERLEKMSVADMTEQEREYFKIRSREKKGVIAVDFKKLFIDNDRSHDILLRDRDLIRVPTKGRTVNVTGQVVHPGLVTFKPGQGLDYYIKKAGGYSWNAHKNKVRIIRAKTGEWVKPKKNTRVDVRDTIFVPEKPERDWWGLFKDVMRVAAEIATVAIVVQQATR